MVMISVGRGKVTNESWAKMTSLSHGQFIKTHWLGPRRLPASYSSKCLFFSGIFVYSWVKLPFNTEINNRKPGWSQGMLDTSFIMNQLVKIPSDSSFMKISLRRRHAQIIWDWVNPSKRQGMDRVFRGMAGLLQGISQGQSPMEVPRNSLASPRKTLSILTLLLRFTFYLK